MSNTVANPRIQLELDAIKPKDDAIGHMLTQLRELKEELGQVGKAYAEALRGSRVAGPFNMGQDQWSKVVGKQYTKTQKLGVNDLASLIVGQLGVADADIQRVKAEMAAKIREHVGKNPKRGTQHLLGAAGVVGRDAATKLLADLSKSEQAFVKEYNETLRRAIGGLGNGARATGRPAGTGSGKTATEAALGAGGLTLTIDPSRINVVLGAGNLNVTLPAGTSAVAAHAPAAAAAPAAIIPAPGGGGMSSGGGVAVVSGGWGDLKRTIVREVANDGRVIESTHKGLGAGTGSGVTTRTTQVYKAPDGTIIRETADEGAASMEEYRRKVRAARAAILRNIRGAASPAEAAAAAGTGVKSLQGLLGGITSASVGAPVSDRMRSELEGHITSLSGQERALKLRAAKGAWGGFVSDFRSQMREASGLEGKLDVIAGTRAKLSGMGPLNPQQAAFAESLHRQQLAIAQQALARFRTATEAEARGNEASVREQERHLRARERLNQQRERAAAQAQRAETSRRTDLYRTQTGQLAVGHAQALLDEALQDGWTVDRVGGASRKGGVYRQSHVLKRTGADGTTFTRTIGMDYNLADYARSGGSLSGLTPVGASVSNWSTSARATDGEGGRYKNKYKDFLTNTENVTTWAASVAVLYKSIELARHSLSTLIETGYQTGRLKQIFTGVGGSALALRDDILALAAANGRETKEAVDSAIQWSRLGLTRAEVGVAVRDSMIAANTAQISLAESTQHLQSVMMSYHLQVSELSSVLGEMTAISNTFNVTNEDMLQGLSRTAAVAKQAGMPLAELMGIIGAAVGYTGQSGNNIGNAVKSLTVALSAPETQHFLKTDYGINARQGDAGDFRGMSDVLRDLYVKYQQVIGAEQQYMLVRLAGKTQASRVAALLDSYIQAQVLAVNAQLNLNTAERENKNVLDSLKASLQGVVTEYARMVVLQGEGGKAGQFVRDRFGIGIGPEDATKGGLTALRNVLALMNTPLGSSALAGLLTLVTALGARFAIMGVQASAAYAKMARSGAPAEALAKMEGHAGLLSNTLNKGYSVMSKAGTLAGRIVGEHPRLTKVVEAASYELGPLLSPISRRLPQGGGALLKGAGAMALAGVVSFAEMIPYIAAATAGIWAFNKAMEGMGFSSQAADDKISKLTQRVEELKASAAAAPPAASLFSTVGRAWDSYSPGKRREAADLLSMMGGGLGISTDQKALLMANGPGAKGVLDEREKNARLLGFIDRQRMAMAAKDASAAADAEAARLTRHGNHQAAASKSAEARRFAGDFAKYSLEADDMMEAAWNTDPHKARLWYRRGLVSHLGDVFSNLPAATSTDRAEAHLAGQRAMLALINTQQDDVAAQQRALVADNAARQEALPAAEKRLEELRSGLTSKWGSADPSFVARKLRAGEWSSETAAILAQENEVFRLKSEDTTRAGTIQATQKMLNEAAVQTRAGLGEAASAIPLARVQDRLTLISGRTGASLDASTFGENHTVVLLNRQGEILRQLASTKAVLASSDTDSITRNEALYRLYVLQSEAKRNQMELGVEEFNLRKAEMELAVKSQRELREKTLFAGPRELLSQIGAQRMAFNAAGSPRQIGLGQWMSWSPELRRNVATLRPELSMEGRELAFARRRLGMEFDPTRASNIINQSNMPVLEQMSEQIRQALGDGAVVAAFTDGLVTATRALTNFTEALGMGTGRPPLNTMNAGSVVGGYMPAPTSN